MDLERLKSLLSFVYLTPIPGAKAWIPSSSRIFSVTSFFSALASVSNSIPFYPAIFLWNSKVPSKVRAFEWSVAHKKVNTNDMMQLRRPIKALNPNWCILCRKSEEMIDHLFLHCPITLGLWHIIFSQVGMEWVKPSSICNMLVISFKCFGNSIRGKTL